MAAEQLKPGDIDKLRALVGAGEGIAEPAETEESASEQNSAVEAGRFREPAEMAPEGPFHEHSSAETELFVKVDEHAAIGEILLGSKGNMKSIADTVALLAKAEKLKSEAIDRMEAILNDIDGQVAAVESKLVPPDGLNAPELGVSAAVSDNLVDLRSELESLKSELVRMKK